MAIDPVEPDTLYAGTRPSGVYRSRDAGRSWQQCALDIAPTCSIGETFVTSVAIDPEDHRTIWVGVEIDGLFAAATAVTVGRGSKRPNDPDVHAMALVPGRPSRVLVSTAHDVFCSVDNGASWESSSIEHKWPAPYARGVAFKPDQPEVMYVGCGESTTGERGYLMRTADFGNSWQNMPLPGQPNSTIWGVATHPAQPRRLLCYSLFGEVYLSDDDGASWRKIEREFGEIRSAVWVPGG